jgi:hypothetical protein|tara:strand:- start:1541 stop:1960 length:420 start_codon:yes stop_codon:yes gene_type:complete
MKKEKYAFSDDELLDLINKTTKNASEHYKMSNETAANFEKVDIKFQGVEVKIEDGNKLIMSKLENIHEKVSENNKLVTKTNGRVKALERWKSFILGAWAVISIVGTILFAITRDYIKRQGNEVQEMKEQLAEINQFFDK